MKKLLGDEFEKLALHLCQRIAGFTDGDLGQPITILEAEPGSGKSRIVQEVYELLRENRALGSHNYWPKLLDDEAKPVLSSRKSLGIHFSEFRRESGALPNYFWLPIHLRENREGVRARQLDDITPYLQAHSPYVLQAIKKASSSDQDFKRWLHSSAKSAIERFSVDSGIELLVAAIAEMGFALPGVAMAITRGTEAVKKIIDNAKAQSDIKEGGSLAYEKAFANLIHRLLLTHASPHVPLILVIEDLHLADTETSELLRLCAQPVKNSPIFVIGMAWPTSDKPSEYQTLKNDLISLGRVEVFAQETSWKFPVLAKQDRISLAKMVLPDLPASAIEVVTEKWKNPFGLISALELGLIRQEVASADGNFDLRVLEVIPPNIQDIYRKRWQELDPDVQDALMFAAESVRSDLDNSTIWPFIATAIVSAAQELATLGKWTAPQETFDRTQDPLGWTTHYPYESELLLFREWILQQVAQENFHFKFGKRGQSQFRDSLTRELTAQLDKQTGLDFDWLNPSTKAVVIAQWLDRLMVAPAELPLVHFVIAADLFKAGNTDEAFHRLFEEMPESTLLRHNRSFLDLAQSVIAEHYAGEKEWRKEVLLLEMAKEFLPETDSVRLRIYHNYLLGKWRYEKDLAAIEHMRELVSFRKIHQEKIENALFSEWALWLIEHERDKTKPAKKLSELLAFRDRIQPQIPFSSKLNLQIWNILGRLQKDLGFRKEALGTFTTLAETAKASFGIGDARFADWLEQQALLIDSSGNFEVAQSLFVGTIHELETALGPNHYLVTRMMSLYSKLARSAGYKKLELEILTKRLPRLEARIGSASSGVQLSKMKLLALQDHFDGDGCERASDEIFALSSHVDFPRECMSNLYELQGVIYRKHGNYRLAEEFFHKAEERIRECEGPKSDEYAEFLLRKADLLEAIGKSHQAFELNKKIKSRIEGIYGKSHRYSLDLSIEIAKHLIDDFPAKALTILKRTERLVPATVDPLESRETSLRFQMFRAYWNLDRIDEAMKEISRCIELDELIWGGEAPETIVHQNHLARLLRRIDKNSHESLAIFRKLSDSPKADREQQLWADLEVHRQLRWMDDANEFDDLASAQQLVKNVAAAGYSQDDLYANCVKELFDAYRGREMNIEALGAVRDAARFEESHFGWSREWYFTFRDKEIAMIAIVESKQAAIAALQAMLSDARANELPEWKRTEYLDSISKYAKEDE